jgi:lysozyme
LNKYSVIAIAGFGFVLAFLSLLSPPKPRDCFYPSSSPPVPCATWEALSTPVPCKTETPEIRYATQTSGAGIILIARFEGFFNKPYTDGAGHCTIGYGHLLHAGECKGGEAPDYISSGQGWELLKDDLKHSEFAVFQNIKVPLLQNQYDAIVSIIFNMGWDNFERTGIPAMINAYQFDKVPDEIRKNSCCLVGIANRRNDEAEVFANGFYKGVDNED